MAKHPAAVALGKLAKGHTSPAKAAASRENGKKGGKPTHHQRASALVSSLRRYTIGGHDGGWWMEEDSGGDYVRREDVLLALEWALVPRSHRAKHRGTANEDLRK